MTARSKLLPAAFALACLALGVWLRTWHLFSQPFWLDEAYSAYAADHGWGWLWQVMPTYESHPPFYYALLHGWSLLFGATLTARRMPGLIVGVGAVLATGAGAWRLGRLCGLPEVRRGWMAAAALALAAFQPLAIDLSRQARPYGLMTMVYALALLPLLKLAEDRRAERPLRAGPVAAVAVAEVAMLWLHSLGPLWAAALGLALACVTLRPRMSAREWALLVGSQAAALLVWLPAALILRREAAGWMGRTWLPFEPATIPSDLAAIYATWDIGARIAALLLVASGAVALWRSGPERRALAALLVTALLPPLAAILASATITPVFLPRVLSPAALPAILLMARGVVPAAPRRPALRVVSPLALGLLLLLEAHTAWQLRQAGPQQDWYRVTAWLTSRVRPGDQVWAYPNDAALPLGYALGDRHQQLPVVPVPGPVPALGVRGIPAAGTRGVLRLYRQDIERLVASPAARAVPTIWLVALTPHLYDPAGDMPRALGRERHLVGRLEADPIQVSGFSRPAARAAAAAAR